MAAMIQVVEGIEMSGIVDGQGVVSLSGMSKDGGELQLATDSLVALGFTVEISEAYTGYVLLASMVVA